jgi:hypothetical protein
MHSAQKLKSANRAFFCSKVGCNARWLQGWQQMPRNSARPVLPCLAATRAGCCFPTFQTGLRGVTIFFDLTRCRVSPIRLRQILNSSALSEIFKSISVLQTPAMKRLQMLSGFSHISDFISQWFFIKFILIRRTKPYESCNVFSTFTNLSWKKSSGRGVQ